MKNNTNKEQNQQGDVMLRVSALPKGCTIIKDERGAVLAEGEISGHYHAIEDGSVQLMEAPNGVRFLVNSGEKSATLRHQEHREVTVDPGVWQVGIVREKDWFKDMVRPVVD